MSSDDRKYLVLRHEKGQVGDSIYPSVWEEVAIVKASYHAFVMPAAIKVLGDLAPGRYMVVEVESPHGRPDARLYDVSPRVEYDVEETADEASIWKLTPQSPSAAEDRGAVDSDENVGPLA